MSGYRFMDGEQVRRAVARVAHEIVERSGGARATGAGRHPHARRAARAPPRARLVGSIEGREPLVRHDRHRALPRRRRARAAGRPRSTRPTFPSTSRDLTVVLVDDVLFTGPHDTGGDGRADRLRPAGRRFSSRCWSTAATASCRSAPTTSARTSRPRVDQQVVVRLAEIDGEDGVYVGGGAADGKP